MNPHKRTGFLYHPDYLKHDTGYGHPEHSQRLVAILEAVRNSDIWNDLILIEPTPATIDQIKYIHDSRYVEAVKQMCDSGGGYIDYDTPISAESFNAALLAAGAMLRGIDAIIAREIDNAFALVRPPGHHATPQIGMGFCIFNNVAIAARYIQREHNLPKILIIDWDLHHGNGTQDAFYDDPTVFYFSIHQSPFYPGTGRSDETGMEAGIESTLNFPIRAGTRSEDYIEIFEQQLKPAALEFQPDFILISAGFDAHQLDPLGGLCMTEEGFGILTDIACEIANTTCNGRLVSVLEGGYSLDGLSKSVVVHLKHLTSSAEVLNEMKDPRDKEIED
ncbi:histone deacetylase [bacterium]|nr:histone deacetylase [bacterium]